MRSTRDVVVLLTTTTVLVFILVATVAIAIAAFGGQDMEGPFRALLVLVGTLAGAISGYVLGKGVATNGKPPDGGPEQVYRPPT
jgi:hypothetical protein